MQISEQLVRSWSLVCDNETGEMIVWASKHGWETLSLSFIIYYVNVTFWKSFSISKFILGKIALLIRRWDHINSTSLLLSFTHELWHPESCPYEPLEITQDGKLQISEKSPRNTEHPLQMHQKETILVLEVTRAGLRDEQQEKNN